MASLNDPDVRIQVLINKDTNQGRFNDAMYFTADEYNALSNQQVKDMANARKDAWVRAVKDAAKNARVITKAEKLAFKAQLDQQLATLTADIAATPDDPVVP